MADFRLRSDNLLSFLLETVPSNDEKLILGSRLATNNQVLLRFLSHHIHDNFNIHDFAKATLQVVQPLSWKSTNPMLSPLKWSINYRTS